MELRQLQLLHTVIESGGFAPAGKALHLSHSAIHRQIRILEKELECCLLTRRGRTVQATEAGRLLADLIVGIQQQISDAERKVREMNQLRGGHLRIGTVSSILVSFLPAVLQRFCGEFRGVRVQLITGMTDDLIEDVSRGKLDLAVVFNSPGMPTPMPNLRFDALYCEEFDWAVGRKHPLAKMERVELAALAAYPFITGPPRSHVRRACERLFASQGLSPTVITELENDEAFDKLIEVSMGFTLRSRHRRANQKIRCFSVPNAVVQVEVGTAAPHVDRVSRAATEFLRACRQAAAAARYARNGAVGRRSGGGGEGKARLAGCL